MTCLTHLNLVAAFDGTELSCQPSCLKPLCSLPVLRILDLRNNVWMSLSHVASLRPVVSRLSYLGLGKFFTHGFDIGVMRSNDIPKSACYNAFLDQVRTARLNGPL